MKRRPLILVLIALVGLLAVHFYGAQMGGFGVFVERSYPGLISTKSWVRCLEEDPASHGYSVYGYLEKRRTDAAVKHALGHLNSDDAYLWLNAATYLGSRNRKEAIPYLIKSLRHTAWRSVEDRADQLRHLTERSFGNNFDYWKEWYLSTSPEVIPDWDSSLGPSPRINTPNTY